MVGDSKRQCRHDDRLRREGNNLQVLVALGPGSANSISEIKAFSEPSLCGPEISNFFVETDPNRMVARFNGHGVPDVVVLDFNFPGFSGLNGIRAALDVIADRPLGVLVSSVNHDVAALLMTAGAKAVLPLDMPLNAFCAAIALLREGMSFAIIDREPVIARLRDMSTLSEREVQVLKGICKGLQNKEIGHAFGIQEVTVKMHARAIIRKLGARNRTHAAMIARDMGIA